MAQAQSRLMALPAELRVWIWSYSVVADDQEPLRISRLSTSACYYQRNATARQPPLTEVNRQIRAEALPIFYAENSFEVITFDYQEVFADEAFLWLKSVGKHATLLKGLDIFEIDIPVVLHLTLTEKAEPELLSVRYSHECAFSTNPRVYGNRQFENLKGRLRKRFEGKGKRTLSCNDWMNSSSHPMTRTRTSKVRNLWASEDMACDH